MAISGTIHNVRISGIACAVPETVVGNDFFASRFGEEKMKNFEKMVGVVERRVAEVDETTADLAFKAAKKLQDAGCWSHDDVDAVLFVTQTPSHVLPATACDLQNRLGVKHGAIAFDVNLGCSGFVYGVFAGASLLQMEGINKVLLLGGDTISKLTSPVDAGSAPLFGDAGFATVLAKSSESSPMHYAFMTDGSGAKAIEADPGGRLVMDGMDVFNFTINEVPALIKDQMLRIGITSELIDYLVLHQANRFVLKQVAMMTGFPMKKVPVSIDRYGNTSSASIPITLCAMKAKDVALTTKKVLMSGFGVGLSWGTLVMDFDFNACFGIADGDDR